MKLYRRRRRLYNDAKYGYAQNQLFLLQDHGVWVNHKKVLRLMQAMNLRSNIAESVVVTPHPEMDELSR
ncbi:transposase [Paenibacillus sp. B1-33]|uniref:transposase n=1 Tax=unclassified Paenibacillus TaxID=185978 RepID=UPI003D2B4E2C